jgi:hypothetical protein
MYDEGQNEEFCQKLCEDAATHLPRSDPPATPQQQLANQSSLPLTQKNLVAPIFVPQQHFQPAEPDQREDKP